MKNQFGMSIGFANGVKHGFEMSLIGFPIIAVELGDAKRLQYRFELEKCNVFVV